MLCFRCGSPVSSHTSHCPNCGQDLKDSELASNDSFADIQRRLRKSDISVPETSIYRIGSLVSDRYELTDVLARGPLGVLYRALDQEVEVDVTLKVIDPSFMESDQEREHFVDTIGSLRRVIHNNVVRYFDVNCDDERCFYVTQFLEGLTLRKVIDLRKEKNERFSIAEVEPLFQQLCAALSVDNATHGCLKPGNVIVLPDLLKVTDLKLAEALPRELFVSSQKDAGSAYYYLAPEVRQGFEYNQRADVFSLAVIVTELLTGQIYQGTRLSLYQIDPEIPEEVDEVIARALSTRPDARYPGVLAFSKALLNAFGRSEKVTGMGRIVAQTLPLGSEFQEGLDELNLESRIQKDTPIMDEQKRATLRFGTQVDDEGESIAKGRQERSATLGYGESIEISKLTGRLSDASNDPDFSALDNANDVPKNEKEITQKLSMDDVEAFGEEDLEPAAPPAERTQNLTIDDIHFEEDPDEADEGFLDDRDQLDASPQMPVDEEVSPASDAISEDGRDLADPLDSERTQQVDEDMLLAQVDEDDEVDDPRFLEGRVRESAAADRAAVAGETNNPRHRPNLAEEEPDLPIRSNRSNEREKRARSVLSAFGHQESGGLGESQDYLSNDNYQDSGYAQKAVAPEVLHQDAVPKPIVSTQDLDLVPDKEDRKRPPMIVAIIIGLAIGALSAVAYSLIQQKGQSVQPNEDEVVHILPDLDVDQVVVKKLDEGPKTTSLAPKEKDSGVVDITLAVDRSKKVDDRIARDKDKEILKAIGGNGSGKTFESQTAKEPKKESAKLKVAADSLERNKNEVKASSKNVVSPTKHANSKKCYPNMALIKAGGDEYCIDRFEAPGRGKKPKTISLSGARQACKMRGLRLCRAKEWMRACAGRFPYGRDYNKDSCNTERSTLVPSGSLKTCKSRWGVYDLSGNVSEWVEDGSAMGGDFSATRQGYVSCMARAKGSSKTGYRCCGDPIWE